MDSLPVQERELLLVDAKTRLVLVGDVLLRPGDQIDSVAFPISGTLSMITQPDDIAVEAATIGREGAASVHSALGSGTASQDLISQIDGEMITVPVATFTERVHEGRLKDIMHRYVESLVTQISITAACNAVHHLDQRCARWLLQTHDRVDSDTFGLTHEFLGVMLGVQRPSVSIAQRTLKDAGCITFSRGSVTVLDARDSNRPRAPATS